MTGAARHRVPDGREAGDVVDGSRDGFGPGGPSVSPPVPLVIRRVAVTMTKLVQGSCRTPRPLRARKDPAARNRLAVL